MAVVNVGDGFPIGMRVLAVDHDLTSLNGLATLLRRCQYLVTTTTKASEVLDMLTENRFDLLIADLHMPEMDGLMLLKVARLFTDVPVILSSVDSDRTTVMKAISLGASDFLVKPLRMEELQNVWQHVFRKKMNSKKKEEDVGEDCEKADKCLNKEDSKKKEEDEDEVYQELEKGLNTEDEVYQEHEKGLNTEDEVYQELEKGLNTEDRSTLKKARVVWTEELHRCFVAAVNVLGVDKAVPRKILQLMKAEKHLTRAHVASHLQKYRLRLKRIGSKATQQVSPFRSSSPSGMISRLDTPAVLNVPELPSSAALIDMSWLDQLLPIESVEPVREAVMPPIDMSFTPLQGGNLSTVTNSAVNSLNVAVNSEVRSPMLDQRQDGSYASHITNLSSIESILNEDLDCDLDFDFDPTQRIDLDYLLSL